MSLKQLEILGRIEDMERRLANYKSCGALRSSVPASASTAQRAIMEMEEFLEGLRTLLEGGMDER